MGGIRYDYITVQEAMDLHNQDGYDVVCDGDLKRVNFERRL